MSDQGKSGAQASDNEAVVTEAEDKPEVAAEETEKVESEDGTEETEGEDATEKAEGEEVPAETPEEKLTKSAKRRERHKAHVAALEAEVARLSEVVAATDRSKPAPDQLGPRPDRAKYEDEAEYAADLAAWKVEEKIIARQNKAHETNTNTARADSAAKKMELFKERAMALSDRYPDIEAKVFKDATLPMSATMAETLMDSEKGPEVAYYLSANREVAQRIKSMAPLAAARELGRIEATISLPKTRTETQAPPPPSTVKGSTAVVTRKTTDPSGDALSDDEWIKRENAREIAKRASAKAGRSPPT